MSLETGRFVRESIPSWTEPMLSSLAEHDPITYHHSVRVGLICARLWEDTHQLLPGEKTFVNPQDMFLAGLLHDVTKKDIPSSILNQHEALTVEEMAILAEHPFTGAAAVAPYDIKLADIIRGHHRYGKNGVVYQDYQANADTQEAMRRPGYEEIEQAQLIMAISDKADTGVNRVRGIHGRTLEEERIELDKRFQNELRQGIVSPAWLDRALQIAWEIGTEDINQ